MLTRQTDNSGNNMKQFEFTMSNDYINMLENKEFMAYNIHHNIDAI